MPMALSLDAQGSYPPAQRYDTALLATLARRAVVAQVSIAYPDHFFESVERAIAFPGPALVQIHAPSPERHGFDTAALFEQAAMAVRSRAWPIFSFDPSRPGVFGSCLDISQNPDPAAPWVTDERGSPITPVHWAMTERRFEAQFLPLDAAAPAPTAPAAFLDPACVGRENLTLSLDCESAGSRVRRRISAALASDALDRTRLWRTLQELSGAVTPFTERVRAEVEATVARSHDDEIDRLRADHEAQLRELRERYDAEAADRVTARLMTLAGYPDGAGVRG
ncbi:MAG: hypothetical protein IPJ41_14085 [Phycisphaerales bacterium]|nr:hypothetical protein [Phycisphaerales bacterium]